MTLRLRPSTQPARLRVHTCVPGEGASRYPAGEVFVKTAEPYPGKRQSLKGTGQGTQEQRVSRAFLL